MPNTPVPTHTDTDNIEAEDTVLNGHEDIIDGAIGRGAGQREREKDVHEVASATQPVDSSQHNATYPGGAANTNSEGQAADQLGNETGANGDTPVAGDVDPDSTRSAEETGQDGDPTSAKKSHGHPWNQ